MKNRLDQDFTLGGLLRFALPTTIMMLVTSLYTIVDGVLASRLVGENALAAINIAYPAVSTVLAVGIMLGTGGSAVDLPLSAAGVEAPLSELVDAFFLTEGWSHDWIVPYYILEHPAEDMAALPALLDQRTEEEARELCGVLGDCLRTADYWDWTPETLAAALGSYGAYLNA